MALPNIEFPDTFQGMQLLPGPTLFRGSYAYEFRKDSNSWATYVLRDVLTFNLSDYLIEPGAGENHRTSWFTVLTLANDYKIQVHFWTVPTPYFHMEMRWLDENDNEIAYSVPIDGINKGSTSISQGESYNLPAMCLKVSMLSQFPSNPGDPESGPLPGTPLSGLVVNWLLGGTVGDRALNYPANGVVTECITFKPIDEVHAVLKGAFFSFNDVDAANTYFKTHGKPIPNDYPPFVPSGMPQDYDPSTPGGGDGNYSDKSDPIDFPDLPNGGALACGAIHAFHVTSGTITSMFQKLWSTSIFDMATWQKLVASPLDCIISLHALPIAPVDGASKHIYFGNFDTELSSPIVANQYVTVDCGYLDVIKFFGSAMDYSPYTKMSIYLPFSGIHDLATEDVQGSRVHVKYNIDVLTGDCAINVKCGQSVLYKFTGNMKMQIPVTSRDDNALGNTIKGTVGMLAGALIGGAVGSGPGAIAGAGISAAASVATHKVTVSRSGELTGNVGILDEFTPYLIIHRPQQSLAVDYNKFKGYPANLTMTLGSCSGYTEVEHIHLTGIGGATDTELSEIESLLKEGVII